MLSVVVTEKPSVARDIATALGVRGRRQGYYESGEWLVTWALGHLVRLAEPQEINPTWSRWQWASLPMLPESWPLQEVHSTRSQLAVVRRLLRRRDVKRVVCATDAGREGELIFRRIQEATGCRKPVMRLWISSLTPGAIRAGFKHLRPASHYDNLAQAARGRAQADWLVGLNLSRAYSLASGSSWSVGRVQTPTLAMLVQREKEIRTFVPEDYFEVEATFVSPAYRGRWVRWDEERGKVAGSAEDPPERLPKDGKLAQAIEARVAGQPAVIESVQQQRRVLPPPQLYDLTELQRHANRLYGYSAKRTLAAAQALYEKHKLITYPRTNSRHLTTEVAATLPAVLEALKLHPTYGAVLAPGGAQPLGPRFVNNAQVEDHHAIIPTATTPVALRGDEAKIYDLIARRLLMAWHPNHVSAVTTLITRVDSPGAVDRFRSRGTTIEEPGWRALEAVPYKVPDALPAGLQEGQAKQVQSVERQAKQTRPPPRYTDGTLLSAMERAGADLTDAKLSRLMRDCGLGTPATRAQIIETLLQRGFVQREQRALIATEQGIALIGAVHPQVKSPELTARWEQRLSAVERGQESLGAFMGDIEQWVCHLIADMKSGLAGGTAPPV